MKILLVRLRLIGDVVLTTPLIRALRRQYPAADITYLVEPAAAPVLEGNPHLTDIIIAERSSGLARVLDDVALARRLRARHYDVAIDLHGGPRAAWLTWASGAQRRIGYSIAGRTWMYTDHVQRSPDVGPRHSVLNQWDLLTPFGIGPADPARDPLEMAVDPAATARVERRLRDAGIGQAATLIVIHASANNRFRRWPESSFVALVCELVRHDATRAVVVFSGPSDAGASDRITRRAQLELGSMAGAVPTMGHFDVGEIRALTRRAAVYIGGDSGPLHVAGTTTAPIVALLGPTLPERSMPWRSPTLVAKAVDMGPLPCRPCSQRVCVPGDFRCLSGITPERVVAAAEQAIAEGRGNDGHDSVSAGTSTSGTV